VAFAVLESDRYLLSSVTGLQKEFDEVSLALKKMSELCSHDWRRQQPDLPVRSEAIRRLTMMSLFHSRRGIRTVRI
jgi:hypothetical protein